jgi:phosphate starvation-inducible PhoH-like protein
MVYNYRQENALPDTQSIHIEFRNNALLPMLYGEQDSHLNKIEKAFNVSAASRGNVLGISGASAAVNASRHILEELYGRLESGKPVGAAEVDAAIRMAQPEKRNGRRKPAEFSSDVAIKTMKKNVEPYSPMQARYMESLYNNEMVFALGPAGSGKTYIAVAMAAMMFATRRVERIILSRPAVEAGERLGFLPGDLKEKIDPYLRPLYDALYDMMPAEKVLKAMETGEIEVAPLAFMRGRTLSNAFIILDEAQNTTPTQMKMFLTRLGENSRMVITGDLTQTDLPRDVKSGLHDAVKKLENIEGIGIHKLTDADVVRHPLAAKIVQAYDEWDKKKKPQ